jgi:hypothetical protein
MAPKRAIGPANYRKRGYISPSRNIQCETHRVITEPSKIQGNPDTATYSQHATINATPTVGITKLITLPKMVDSPKISTWSNGNIRGLLLTEIMRCVRASAPDVGLGYNKFRHLSGKSSATDKDFYPGNKRSHDRHAKKYPSHHECVSQRYQNGYRHCEGRISCVGGRHVSASTTGRRRGPQSQDKVR